MTEINPLFVMLGRDAQGKPHAARFAGADAELASKAADLMGYDAVRVQQTELKGLAANLPVGKVFASGRAFVPFTKAETFDRLATLVENGSGPAATTEVANTATKQQAQTAQKQASSEPPARFLPRSWDEVGAGSLVLAYDGEAWWEALVYVAQGDRFRLTWRDYPREPAIVRQRHELALLCPDPA